MTITAPTFAAYLDHLVHSRPTSLRSSTIAVLLDVRAIAVRVFSRRQLAEEIGRLYERDGSDTIAHGVREAMQLWTAFEKVQCRDDLALLAA